jgi:hypothetical protein
MGVTDKTDNTLFNHITDKTDETLLDGSERIAQLDLERNERDRLAKRGYDYDGRGDQSYRFEPGETVIRIFAPDRQFGRCDICHEPAAIVLHRNATINGHQRFCASCWHDQGHDHEAFSKRHKRRARTCPLCGGKWEQNESADDACTTRNKHDIAHCLKYRFLMRELDDDDLNLPYVTTGPYCPWPQAAFQPRSITDEEREAEIDRLAAMDAADGNDTKED